MPWVTASSSPPARRPPYRVSLTLWGILIIRQSTHSSSFTHTHTYSHSYTSPPPLTHTHPLTHAHTGVLTLTHVLVLHPSAPLPPSGPSGRVASGLGCWLLRNWRKRCGKCPVIGCCQLVKFLLLPWLQSELPKCVCLPLSISLYLSLSLSLSLLLSLTLCKFTGAERTEHGHRWRGWC